MEYDYLGVSPLPWDLNTEHKIPCLTATDERRHFILHTNCIINEGTHYRVVTNVPGLSYPTPDPGIIWHEVCIGDIIFEYTRLKGCFHLSLAYVYDVADHFITAFSLDEFFLDTDV